MRTRSIALAVVSAGALTTLVGGTALGLDRRLEGWLMTQAETAVTPEPPAVTPTAPVHAAPAAVAVAPDPIPAPDPEPAPASAIVVPDLDGMRVGPARRAMRALGLRLEIRDSAGAPIPPHESPFYRLRGATISPPAGTTVAPGARVRAEAETQLRAFVGY